MPTANQPLTATPARQIIALGGGNSGTDPSAIDRYILAQSAALSGAPRPKVGYLPTAGGDNPEAVVNFYRTYTSLNCEPSHLYLFRPHTADMAGFLLSQDVIYVGGGNTKSMLALWREWNLHVILKQALEQGIVLAGSSAGAICWFEQGSTDSIPGDYTALNCLGYLPGSCCPHYDGEPERRPSLHRLIGGGTMQAGIALHDGAAAHFINGELHQVVTWLPTARAYRVEPDGSGGVRETELAHQRLD